MLTDPPAAREDLRRRPRLDACCRVDVLDADRAWTAVTEDLSARGCRIVTSREPRSGSVLRLRIATDLFDEELEVMARVAWSDQGRAGVVFEPLAPKGPSASTWFERVLAADPPAPTVRRAHGSARTELAEARARRAAPATSQRAANSNVEATNVPASVNDGTPGR